MDARHEKKKQNRQELGNNDPIVINVTKVSDPQTEPPLLAIPLDVRKYLIYPRFNGTTLYAFTQICRRAEKETALDRLLRCAAHALPSPVARENNSAQQDVAEALAKALELDKSRLAALDSLKRHPELLFTKGLVVKDPAQREIYGSAYQVFLGAGDIWALNIIHTEIIPLIKDGAAIAEAQYKEQFPNHAAGNLYDNRNKAQISQAKEILEEIAVAISADPCTDGKATRPETMAAINKLREHLAPKKGEVIKSGLHSPPEILKMMHEVYNKYFALWTWNQRLLYSLYSCNVIVAGEAVATAVDAQYYIKGLFYFDENTPPSRTISYWCSFSFCLGFIDVKYGIRSSAEQAVSEAADLLGEFCRAKTSALLSICSINPVSAMRLGV